MLQDKAFRIGRIIKTHGVRGQLTVAANNKISEPDEWPEWIFLDIDVGLVPFRTRPEEMIWRDENHIIIALEDLLDQDGSRKMVGYDLWFPVEFKMILEDSVSRIHPLVGFILIDSERGELGKITELIELPNNPLFKIILDNKEILIPAREEWITDMDEQNQSITMDLPDGLIDL